MRKSGLTGDEAYALSKRRGTSGDLGPLKKELSLLKGDFNKLSEKVSDKATLENGVVKFWKTSTEENRTDTLLYSVDISSIGGTGGLDLENLTLSVSQVGDYQRLSMSDGTTTKNVDIPIITITDEQVQTAVTEYLDANPVQTGATQEEAEQIQKNTNDIANLKTNKVDKVSGKGLSTEDYTTEEKSKLAGLSNYDDTTVKQDIANLKTNKVDKVEGKGLSTNDFTNEEKDKLSSLSNYDDSQIKGELGELKSDIGQLSEEKVENPLTGIVGQILEIETVDESGKPKTYKAVNKPSGGGEVTDEQISNAVDNYMTAHPFTETDPTVPDWAKQPEKPTYTASEVGALPVGTKIPSKTSDLQNDSGFLTYHQDLSDYALKSEVPNVASDIGAESEGTAESKVSAHNVSDTAHNDIRLLVQGLIARLNALADSDDTTLDQMSEVVAYIKSNKSLIDAITTSKVNVSDIIDNLTTNVSNKPLSAAQGVKLKALIDAIKVPVNLSELAGDTTHRTVTDAEKTAWNNKSTFSGNYNDLTNKPSLFSGNYNDLSGKPTLITEERVNELINAKLPKSAEEVQY